MNVVIVGTGYVGLVTGACIATGDHEVTCLDIDEEKIAALSNGVIPIHEPGLDALVEQGVAGGNLAFSTDADAVVPGADVVFIAVGTPAGLNGQPQLDAVFASVDSVATRLGAGATIVIKSTVPIGTNSAVSDRVRDVRGDDEISVVSNPEFLRQGAAVSDFLNPDRIVIGAWDDESKERIIDLYASVIDDSAPRLATDPPSAELIKYAANSFLAVKLSFVNEIADLCEQTGASIAEVTAGMGTDPRIGNAFLNPGPGYGGSCFPKDTSALLRASQGAGAPSRIVAAAIDANRTRRRHMADRVMVHFDAGMTPVVAVLGVTFKANTDDVRESPAIDIVHGLMRAGATVKVYDPEGMEGARRAIGEDPLCGSVEEAVEGADALVIATEWDEFAKLDLRAVSERMKGSMLFDFRNIFDPSDAAEAGMTYYSIGRPIRN